MTGTGRRVWRARGTGLLATVAAVLMMAACSSSTSKGHASATTSTPPVSGGSATAALQVAITSWDPATSRNVIPYGQWLLAVFGQLVQVSPQGQVIPELAQSVSSTDQVHWTLVLKPNLKFSDGTPFDAAAVQSNWQRYQDPTVAPQIVSFSSQIASMQVVDPTTLTFTLKAPNSQFPRYLMDTGMGMIGSPTAIAHEGPSWSQKPVGAGPFVLTSWTPGGDAQLTRNDSYWDAPRPYLRNLTLRGVVDEQQMTNVLVSGGAAIGQIGTPCQCITTLKQDGFQVQGRVDSGGQGFVFNVSKAPFDDVRVRQAFALALDFNQINQAIAEGTAAMATTLYPTDSPYYDPGVPTPCCNLAKAQSLIDAYEAQHGPIKATMLVPNALTQAG
ncbi:MAG: ABC transporter substrate-binding protein, partial [Acidimicrobiales bacterium]|nr:ABC transporter substrate-binding protein [Acidimicrobiales bacterium]